MSSSAIREDIPAIAVRQNVSLLITIIIKKTHNKTNYTVFRKKHPLLLLLDNLLKTQPKLLPKNLTFRPLSEAFIRRSWYSVLPLLFSCITLRKKITNLN